MTKTVGIIGGGQLGYFLALAAQDFGLHSRIFGFAAEEPCNVLAGHHVGTADKASLMDFARGCDVLTYEFENLDADWLASAQNSAQNWTPNLAALRVTQDRLQEKSLCQNLSIPVTPFRAVDSLADLGAAVEQLQLPLILKTRRMGYDGKGQAVVRSDAAAAYQSLGGKDLIAEAFIPFDSEASLIGARNKRGETVFFPLNLNQHKDGILRVTAPQGHHPLQHAAEAFMQKIFAALDYVGVLTIEFFVKDNALMVNELAPRVHNSGHWTLEGATVSQFAAHIRAICNLPLLAPKMIGFPAMVNIIGERPPAAPPLPGFMHDYRKSARPGRKLGHITTVAPTAAERDEWISYVTGAVP